LLVVISVVAILVTILFTAVQASREAARSVNCQSNLRQLGLAISQYEATFGTFPPGLSRAGSLHVSILPFLEQRAAYQTLDPSRQMQIDDMNFKTPIVSVFLCPSDGTASSISDGRLFGTNYAGCAGTWHLRDGWNGVFQYWTTIPQHSAGPVRNAEVTDGLSNTVMMSDILRADQSFARLRVNWNTPRRYDDIDAFAHACASVPPNPREFGWRGDNFSRGTPWTDGNIGVTLYNHVLTPNHPSCYNERDVPNAASTASSGHRNGVNTLYADGHVTFVANSIDREIWRDAASRSSN
jgi:prepilin-type processing-associated H-X9-DG protein